MIFEFKNELGELVCMAVFERFETDSSERNALQFCKGRFLSKFAAVFD